MPEIKEDPSLGINSWLQDELSHQYKFDHTSVDQEWADLLQSAPPQNGGSVPASEKAVEPTSDSIAAPATAAAVMDAPLPVSAPPIPPPAPASTAVARQEVKTIGPGDQLIP